jgi:hypothetical protein
MASSSAAEHLFICGERIRLPVSVEELRRRYRDARPFPHLVIDDMFPEELLSRVGPELPDRFDRSHWVFENNDSLVRYNLRSAAELGDAGYQLTAFLHSANFLYFLTELTGIGQLLPDPYLQGGGYNSMPASGFFNVHADRNTAYETGLTRRLAVNIYLNKDWPPEFGGQLELWNRGGTSREVSVNPIFNRTVIFDTSAGHLHGVPTVCCPEHRTRNSFLTYFHTATTGAETAARAHGTVYAPSYYGPPKLTAQALVKDCVPPMVYRGLRRLFRNRRMT